MSDPKQQAEKLIAGASLGGLLGATPEAVAALRKRSLELFEARQYEPCIAVLEGLAALGDVHPADALMLAECLGALGRHELARAARDSANRLLEAMDP